MLRLFFIGFHFKSLNNHTHRHRNMNVKEKRNFYISSPRWRRKSYMVLLSFCLSRLEFRHNKKIKYHLQIEWKCILKRKMWNNTWAPHIIILKLSGNFLVKNFFSQTKTMNNWNIHSLTHSTLQRILACTIQSFFHIIFFTWLFILHPHIHSYQIVVISTQTNMIVQRKNYIYSFRFLFITFHMPSNKYISWQQKLDWISFLIRFSNLIPSATQKSYRM